MLTRQIPGTGGMKTMRLSDIEKLARDNPDAALRWSLRWQGTYYGGTTTQDYPVSLGASEIQRRIRAERSDRCAIARIVSEEMEAV